MNNEEVIEIVRNWLKQGLEVNVEAKVEYNPWHGNVLKFNFTCKIDDILLASSDSECTLPN